MKNVIITGGGGAIGAHVIRHFLSQTNWNITLIDSFRHKGDPERLKYSLHNHPEWDSRVTVIKHDLCCPIPPEMVKKIGPVNHILHLAALSDVFFSVENPVYTIRNNIESTLTMLEFARNVEHESFIYFSTDEVYGPTEIDTAHREWDTHRPSNPYAASKAASEDICYTYWRAYGVKLIITNTMNNLGETQSYSKFPSMIQRKLALGETIDIHCSTGVMGTRFYIHSEDTADALLYILNNMPPHEHIQGELDEPDRYHLTGSERISNSDLVLRIAEITKETPLLNFVEFHRDNPAHDIHYGLEDNKLRSAGWTEKLGLEAGLKRTIEWERNQND